MVRESLGVKKMEVRPSVVLFFENYKLLISPIAESLTTEMLILKKMRIALTLKCTSYFCPPIQINKEAKIEGLFC